MKGSSARGVTLFEVGPRDGLQNEKKHVGLNAKLEFIRRLVVAGIRHIEVGAFVRADKVPQMADTESIFEAIHSKRCHLDGANAYALVANTKGLDRAIQQKVSHIAVFTAASDKFNEHNIGRSVQDSLREYKEVVRRAKLNRIQVRGYVSTVFGCPYEGKVSAIQALRVIRKMGDLGVEQVSIGDTIGVATPTGVRSLMKKAIGDLGVKRVAGHFHDTRGTALANVWVSYEEGVRTFDSSTGGLGGCPYAPGASGNVATEDLVAMFQAQKISTGIQLEKICLAAVEIFQALGRESQSRVLRAFLAQSSVRGSSKQGDKQFFRFT